MSERRRRLLGEVARFFLVAQAATIVAVVLFNVLAHGWLVGEAPMADQAVPAYVLAHSVGMVISYHGSRGWVFPHRPPQRADGGWTAYVVINLAAMLLPVGCLVVSRYALGLDDPLSDNLAANGIGLVLAFGARFYLFRRFVFQRPAADADRSPTTSDHSALPTPRVWRRSPTPVQPRDVPTSPTKR